VAYTQNRRSVCGCDFGFGVGAGPGPALSREPDELELLLLFLPPRLFRVCDLRRSRSGSGNDPGMLRGGSSLLGGMAGSRR
jgi:hypothetical protein